MSHIDTDPRIRRRAAHRPGRAGALLCACLLGCGGIPAPPDDPDRTALADESRQLVVALREHDWDAAWGRMHETSFRLGRTREQFIEAALRLTELRAAGALRATTVRYSRAGAGWLERSFNPVKGTLEGRWSTPAGELPVTVHAYHEDGAWRFNALVVNGRWLDAGRRRVGAGP